MTDEKGGSADKGADTPPSTGNKIVQISLDAALAENETLKRELTDRDKTIGELTQQLKAANDVLEAQEKAKLMADILPRSNFSIEDLSAKTLEELKEIQVTLDQAKLPTFKNIRLGVPAVDQPNAPNLTVGDLSIVTAKRKAMERS